MDMRVRVRRMKTGGGSHLPNPSFDREIAQVPDVGHEVMIGDDSAWTVQRVVWLTPSQIEAENVVAEIQVVR